MIIILHIKYILFEYESNATPTYRWHNLRVHRSTSRHREGQTSDIPREVPVSLPVLQSYPQT